MPGLFPDRVTAQEPEQEAQQQERRGYYPSAYFDGEDFLRDGAHKILRATGTDAWIHWCQKCLSTQKGAYLTYGEDYGIDIRGAFRTADRDLIENILTREITEALEADPLQRLSRIEGISYRWQDDSSVEVTVNAVGIGGNTEMIAVTLGGEGRIGRL